MANTQQFSDTPYRDQDEAAAFMRLSPRTLEGYRVSGQGPAYRKIGKRTIYHVDDLIEWIEARKRTSTSDGLASVCQSGGSD